MNARHSPQDSKNGSETVSAKTRLEAVHPAPKKEQNMPNRSTALTIIDSLQAGDRTPHTLGICRGAGLIVTEYADLEHGRMVAIDTDETVPVDELQAVIDKLQKLQASARRAKDMPRLLRSELLARVEGRSTGPLSRRALEQLRTLCNAPMSFDFQCGGNIPGDWENVLHEPEKAVWFGTAHVSGRATVTPAYDTHEGMTYLTEGEDLTGPELLELKTLIDQALAQVAGLTYPSGSVAA